jgi:hypothetical protein
MAPVYSTLAVTPSAPSGTAAATEVDTDFDVFILDESDLDDIIRNPYVKQLADNSFLNILQPKRAKNAFNEKDEREKRLFQLFLSNSLWEAILVWTNEKLVSKGKNTITIKKLMAYGRLELAMSLIQIGSIRKYWETKHFSGHHDFREHTINNLFRSIILSPKMNRVDAFL